MPRFSYILQRSILSVCWKKVISIEIWNPFLANLHYTISSLLFRPKNRTRTRTVCPNSDLTAYLYTVPQTGRSMTTSPYCFAASQVWPFRVVFKSYPGTRSPWRLRRFAGVQNVVIRLTPMAKRGRPQNVCYVLIMVRSIHAGGKNTERSSKELVDWPDCASRLQEQAPRPGTKQNYLHSADNMEK